MLTEKTRVLTEEEVRNKLREFERKDEIIHKGLIGACTVSGGIALGSVIIKYSAIVDTFIIEVLPTAIKTLLTKGGWFIGGSFGGITVPPWFVAILILGYYTINQSEVTIKKRKENGYYDKMACKKERKDSVKKLLKGENLK